MEFDFQDEVALVTGGASGIGRATAATLAARGATVVSIDVERTPRDGRDRFGDLVDDGELVVGDVTDESVVDRAVDRAESLGNGHVTVAVNCAGVGSSGRLDQIDRENLRDAYEVHVEGTYNVCRAVVPEMADHGGGAVVNTSSVAAQVGWPATADYAPAKGAIESMTRQLATDFSPEGVRVNAVAPGFVRTGMNADVWSEDRDAKFDERVGEETARERTLLPYLGEPEDIASVVAFLASDHARFVTGQVLTADGGWTVSAW